MARRYPFRTWIGLALILISQTGAVANLEPFETFHTPIAWTGYILLVDGIVWKRRGNSWLSDSRAEFVFLAFLSVPFWIIFELYNKYSLHNWHYLGLPESLLVRYLGYAWSFATILPAIFETGELVSSLRDRRAPEGRAAGPEKHRPGVVGWLCVAAGVLMLVVPIVYPSPYLAASVWLGFALFLDPLNANAGAESILGDARAGRYSRLVNLMVAGLICGIVWECWNFWAGAKWKYTVPILPDLKVFEMPVAGYGGFPAFAVECFTMYVAVRFLIWRAGARPISI